MTKGLRKRASSKESIRPAVLLLVIACLVTAAGLFVKRGRNASGSLAEAQGRMVPAGPQVISPPAKARGMDGGSKETALPRREGVIAQAAKSPRDSFEMVLPEIQAELRETADAIHRFAQRGDMDELRQLSRESVESLVRQLASELSIEEIARLMEDSLGLPPMFVVSRPDPAGAALEVFDALSENPHPSHAQSALIMTDACAPDGSVTGSTHVIPAGTRRVYAVFENNRSLSGLGHVLAVWRNPDDDRMVFAETEPIHAGSSHNYVWLELSEGWAAGRYRVDLFDPREPSTLLASEPFSVR